MAQSINAQGLWATLVSIAAACTIVPAFGQDDCGPNISSLAQTVLEGRQQLPPLQARRFGTRAIYLLTRYVDLPDADTDRLLSEAIEARIHGADDLDFAWRLSRDGLENTLAEAGPEALAAVVDTARPSSLRALLVAGHANAVMAAIAALPEGGRSDPGQLAVTVVFDQPDARKAELGAMAAEHGLGWLAAGFAAAQQDPGAWSEAVNGLSTEETDTLVTLWGWLPALNGNPAIIRSTALQDAESKAFRDASRLVSWAAAMQPEHDLIATFLNQTGKFTETAEVAKVMLKQFADGSLSTSGPLDQGWLATYRALDAAGFDAESVKNLFGSASLGINRVDRDTVSDVLDWIVVVDALSPYLNGSVDLPPDLPDNLSDGFSGWPHWTELAIAIREAPATAVASPSPDDLPILAELLLAAGHRETLAQMLEQAPPSLATVTLANDFAGRLDRLCEAHLWHKGEAILLAGRALYGF